MVHSLLTVFFVLLGLCQFILLILIIHLGFKGVLDVYGGSRISFKRLNQFIANPELANYKRIFIVMKYILAFQMFSIGVVIMLCIISWSR